MTARNIIFSTLASLLFCSPLLLFGIKTAGLDVPICLSPDSAKYLSGGYAPAHIRESLSLEGFMNKKLQASIENGVENYIPAKASVLLNTSAMQRCAIAFSENKNVDPSCYPTYFGSSIVLSPSLNAMFQMPLKDTGDRVTQAIEEFAKGITKIAKDFPEKTFVIIVADNSSTSLANPAVSLSNGVFATSDANRVFQSAANNVNNIHVVDVAQTTPEEYLNLYYRTDHHWNGWGAVDAYAHAINLLLADDPQSKAAAIAPIQHLSPLEDCEWLRENGSLARNGLCMLNEGVNEPALPLESIEVEQGETPPVVSNHGVQRLKDAGAIASYDFYQTWYGQWKDSKLANSNAPIQNSSALIICDSFGTAFKWVASTGYRQVEARYDVHDSRDIAVPLRETLKDSTCDTVFLVGRVTSFQQVLSRFPDYLD